MSPTGSTSIDGAIGDDDESFSEYDANDTVRWGEPGNPKGYTSEDGANSRLDTSRPTTTRQREETTISISWWNGGHQSGNVPNASSGDHLEEEEKS